MEENLKVTTKKKLRKVKNPPTVEQATCLSRDELIRSTAYQFFVDRGCLEGYAEIDWFEAERQVDHLLSTMQSAVV